MAKTQTVATPSTKESNLPVQQDQVNTATSNLPAYLQKKMLENQNKPPVGIDNLKQYWTPDRIKIIQAQSGERFKQFPTGSVVLLPQLTKIADPGQPFWITPIFQYNEFCVWNPYGLKGQLAVIRDRTYDPSSIIAKKSRSRNVESLYEVCPDLPPNKQAQKTDRNFMLRYCEHINFLCVLVPNTEQPEHPANRHVNIPVLFTFHHSGFFEGKTLSTLIVNRGVDLYAAHYELSTSDKTNAQGTWKGFNINNPGLDSGIKPFVEDEVMYNNYESLYKSIQKQFESGEIYSGAYEEDISDSEPAASSGIDDGKM